MSRQSDPIYNQRPPASPVHLSSSILMRSGSSGAVQQAALKNPMGQDMELLEIKFELSGADNITLTNLSGYAQVFGGAIWCELNMGGFPLTNGAIPVWNFGRAENLAGEIKTQNFGVSFLSYSWRLPRPLFIPAGAVVVPRFVHTGYIPDTVNVRIGYSCRTVFTKPKKIYLPWVAKYASKVINPVSSVLVDSSTELDLVNPHKEELYLQRFVGRTMTVEPVAPAGGRENGDNEVTNRYLTLRIRDSYGRPVVKDFTPFRSVFEASTRSWEMDNGACLDPESYYIVEMKKIDTVSVGSDTTSSLQTFISMVGWREVDGSAI